MSTATTHIKTEKQLAPALRFKDVQGDWNETSLEDVIQILSGFAFKSSYFSEDGQPLLTPKNFTKDGRANFNDRNTKFTTEIVDKKYLCKSGDLLVLLTDLTPSCELLGKPVVLTDSDGEVLLNQRIIKISVDNTKISKEFLSNVFLTETYHRRIKDTATGTTVRHSSNKIIYAYKTGLPSLTEQQKIASFLSAVDKKIQQLTKKKVLLEQYKKGIMQQLFSGQLRFKDENGNPYPDWEEKRLGDISTFLDGRRKPIKSGDRSKMQGEYPYYGASGIIDHVNNYIFDEEIILLGEDGENIISRNLPLAFRVSGKCWINNHAHVIKPNKNTDIDFLTYSLERINYEPYNTGTAQPKLNQAVCRSLPLNLPSYPEQQKIAAYLSSIDTKIESVINQITQTQTFKKGLLQQMFV